MGSGCTIHHVMALPPGVEEPSCILTAHFHRFWILQAGNAVHHLRYFYCLRKYLISATPLKNQYYRISLQEFVLNSGSIQINV